MRLFLYAECDGRRVLRLGKMGMDGLLFLVLSCMVLVVALGGQSDGEFVSGFVISTPSKSP